MHETIQPISVLIELRKAMDILLSVSSTRNTFLTLLSEAQESTYRMWAGRTTETFFLDPLICSERLVVSLLGQFSDCKVRALIKEDIYQGQAGENITS